MRYGLPTLLRQGATSLSAAMLSRVSAEFGAPVLAGMGLCARAVMPFTSAVIGFGQGFQPVCGAAFGAKQTARCQTAYRVCQRVLLVFSLAVGAAVFAFAPALTARFAHDAQTADVAGRALRLHSAVFFAQSAVILMTMLTQSLGQTVRAAARVFGISKSTVHKDVTSRLRRVNHSLYEEVQKVLTQNKQERHIRGGMATRHKYHPEEPVPAPEA